MRAPVYVQIHRRPRLVMLAIDTFSTLCTQAMSSDRAAPAIDAVPLLDTISDLVLIADRTGAIIATSGTARVHFGIDATIGRSILGVAPASQHHMLSDTIQRVLQSGVTSHLRFASSARVASRLAVSVTPIEHGVALIATDETPARDDAMRRAVAHATREAMLVTERAATAVVDRSGYILTPCPALAALSGIDVETQRQRLLASLFARSARARIIASLNDVFAQQRPAAIDATLVRTDHVRLKVRLGLAPVWQDGRVEQIVALITIR